VTQKQLHRSLTRYKNTYQPQISKKHNTSNYGSNNDYYKVLKLLLATKETESNENLCALQQPLLLLGLVPA
jgi:hypothetical protein